MMYNYLPTDSEICVLGRTKINQPLPLFWTGSGLELYTNSGTVYIDLETEYKMCEEWIRIEVDGFCMQRILLPKGRSKICAFREWPSDKVRKVRILKETQPVREDEKKYLLIYGIECDGQLVSIPRKKHRIEFIGDSLSAGEGLGGPKTLLQAGSALWGLEGHYALKVADYFDADYRIMAESGWGVCCSASNDTIRIMPKYYEMVCGTVLGETNKQLGAFEQNDFDNWQPDVIVVNLGSNDGFAMDKPGWTNPEDGTVHRQLENPYGGVEKNSAIRFERAVVDFLKKLRRWNPQAYILWVYGMCEHRMAPYINKAVQRYAEEEKDGRVSFQILPMSVFMWMGCNGHPGKKEHELTAHVIVQRLEEILATVSNQIS